MKLRYTLLICLLSLIINILSTIYNFDANFNGFLSPFLFLFLFIPRVLANQVNNSFQKVENPILLDKEIQEYNKRFRKRMRISFFAAIILSLIIFYAGIAGSMWMQTMYTSRVLLITWIGWPVLLCAAIAVTIDVIHFFRKLD